LTQDNHVQATLKVSPTINPNLQLTNVTWKVNGQEEPAASDGTLILNLAPSTYQVEVSANGIDAQGKVYPLKSSVGVTLKAQASATLAPP